MCALVKYVTEICEWDIWCLQKEQSSVAILIEKIISSFREGSSG